MAPAAARQAAFHAESVATSALALSRYQAGADADEVDLDLVQVRHTPFLTCGSTRQARTPTRWIWTWC